MQCGRFERYKRTAWQAVTVQQLSCQLPVYLCAGYVAAKNIDSCCTDLVVPNLGPQSTLPSISQLVPNKVFLTTFLRVPLCQ